MIPLVYWLMYAEIHNYALCKKHQWIWSHRKLSSSGVTPMGSGCANPRAPELRGHPKGAPSAWVPIKIPWNSIQRQKMCPFKLQDFRNWWNQTYSGAPRTKSVFCNGSVPIEPNPYSWSPLKAWNTTATSTGCIAPLIMLRDQVINFPLKITACCIHG